MTEPDTASLRSAFDGRLFTAAADQAPYLTDYRRRWTGRALAVAEPATAADVAAVVRWCAANRTPVVAQGGNTGLSGGSVPDSSGRAVVVSLRRLDKIRAVDPANSTMTVEAGVTLVGAQDAARASGRLFPLSLAAEGSCTIGGNLATNAGGVQVLRYGNARELCLGLEVVTASGELWNGLRGLRKDNTGYDLRDLLIGSEGTLGIITAAVLKLFPRPVAELVALAAVPSPAAALEFLAIAQARLSAALTAFEILSHVCLELVLRHAPNARDPLGAHSPWYVLLEVSDAESEPHAAAALEAVLAAALEAGAVTDAVVSSSLAQFDALWELRENISDAQGAEGPAIKHDIALPISRIPEFIETTGAALGRVFPGTRLVVFGHLGDGNLHYNLSPAAMPAGSEREAAFRALEGPANRLVHDAVAARDGSISAEHGLGVLRRDESSRYKSAVEVELMRRIKRALDPSGLLNPGKMLVEQDAATA
jgi:FAD/FMN-containing dehydrogenase